MRLYKASVWFRRSPLSVSLLTIACVGSGGELDPGLQGKSPPPTTAPEALTPCAPVKLSTDDSDVTALKLIEASGLFGLAYVDRGILKFSIVNPKGGLFTTQALSAPRTDAFLIHAKASKDRFEVLWSDEGELTWSTLDRTGALLGSKKIEGLSAIDHAIPTTLGWWLLQGNEAQHYTDPNTIERTHTWAQETGRPFAWLEQDGTFLRAVTAEIGGSEQRRSMVKVTNARGAQEFETNHLVAYEKGQLVQGTEGGALFLTAETELFARRVDILMYDLQHQATRLLFEDVAFYRASAKVLHDQEAYGMVWNMAGSGWNSIVMFTRVTQDGVILNNTEVAGEVTARDAYFTDVLYKADAGLFSLAWTDVRDDIPDDDYPQMYKKRQVYMMHIRDECSPR